MGHRTLRGVLGHLHRHSRHLSTTSDASIRALIIGSPGSGKGTLSSRLLNVVPSLAYISGGDVLRQEIQKGTDIGKQADRVIRKGGLMPDEIMMEMISTKVQNLGVESSWLLDGFPRTRGQAVMFDDALRGRGHALNLVLHLDVPNDVVMSRILDRWIHEKSGRTYNMRFDPPKVEGKDDVTGEDLVKRSDDDAETFKARLDSFQAQTKPMIDYFAEQGGANQQPVYVRLQGTSSNEIWPRMLKVVKDRFPTAVKE